MQRMKAEIPTLMNLSECSKNDDTVCPICKNRGIVLYLVGDRTYSKECECGIRQRQIMERKLSFANIPEAFKSVKLKDFKTDIYKKPESKNKAENAAKAIKYWLDNFNDMRNRGMGLYLYSLTKGSGKTLAAAGLSNELIQTAGVQAKFSTSLQILNEIKASWDPRNDYGENKLLADLSRADVLVIDDFGTEQEKGWINEKFYQIINGRYVDKKNTIFTSNSRLDNLQYDERITNRIKERTFQIPFPEESVRDELAKKNMQELIKGIKKQED